MPTYNETIRAITRSMAAPLMTSGPNRRLMFRLFFESSLLVLSSLEMNDDDDSSTLGSTGRLLMGLSSSMAEMKDREIVDQQSKSNEGLFLPDPVSFFALRAGVVDFLFGDGLSSRICRRLIILRKMFFFRVLTAILD